MKVILTGSTGFIGNEVLQQCLQHPSITSIVALSRRDLPQHDKLKVAIMNDFLSYPDAVREEIKGADACIWTLGLIPSKIPKNDEAGTRRVSIEYTLTAAKEFEEHCQKPFRFIYVSGAGAERGQDKPLWVMQDYRRLRGEVESGLLDFAESKPDFSCYIMQPGLVLSRGMSLRNLVFGLAPSIRVDDMARSMVDLALKGGEKRIWENDEMKERKGGA
ncbi:uncharacterized protein N7483_002078 [Penicillium malachiteum]|uniref:uncharacterized protein n=1 Tax=Penicillium malachiteum TaxID=1324776 RepID=UPI0025467584|nr:uncharacterized protein N7483_002078 [Penicillium malachiteum]KAJ5736953.1 hypothetical protein N7483_002078 [Penicillium malachiteum]